LRVACQRLHDLDTLLATNAQICHTRRGIDDQAGPFRDFADTAPDGTLLVEALPA
jgi:hypothetical protein